MSSTFWNAVFAIGIAQGVVLVVALFLQRAPNRRASRALALVVVAFTLAHHRGGPRRRPSRDGGPARRLPERQHRARDRSARVPLRHLRARSGAALAPSERAPLPPAVLGVAVWLGVFAAARSQAEPLDGFATGRGAALYVVVKAAVLFAYLRPVSWHVFEEAGHELGSARLRPPFYGLLDGYADLVGSFVARHTGAPASR